MPKTKTIISASRRTDIPAFYWEWFQNQLRNGYVDVPNPLYKDKIARVDLTPEEIHSIVLWSKDMRNVINNPGLINNYNLYFQYTITGYNKLLEPNVPDYHTSIETLKAMREQYDAKQFNIRFDPIVISTNGDLYPNPKNPVQARLDMFERLLNDLHDLDMDDCRLTTSFMQLYGHVRTRMEETKCWYKELTPAEEMEIMGKMSEIARKYNRDIYMCANDRFLNAGMDNVKKGHCIDGDILEELFGKVSKAKDGSQRKECGCIKSRDIGSYQHECFFKCMYCYARKD